MLDYRTSLEYLTYDFISGGIVRIENTGDAKIFGATFAVKASEIKSSKKDIKQKTINGQLIFWLDVEGGESIDLLLK